MKILKYINKRNPLKLELVTVIEENHSKPLICFNSSTPPGILLNVSTGDETLIVVLENEDVQKIMELCKG